MTEINFWLAEWEYECCGPLRRTGDEITVSLSLQGSIMATEDPNSVEQLGGGEMSIVGHATQSLDTEPGSVVTSAEVSFGIPDIYADAQLRCTGKLWEERHGSPEGGAAVGRTTGRVLAILGHPATYERVGERSWTRVGFGSGLLVGDTDSYPTEDSLIDDVPRRGHGTETRSEQGQWRMRRPDEEPIAPSGWAFEFVLEVSNQGVTVEAVNSRRECREPK